MLYLVRLNISLTMTSKSLVTYEIVPHNNRSEKENQNKSASSIENWRSCGDEEERVLNGGTGCNDPVEDYLSSNQ